MTEKLQNQADKKGSFEEKLEPVLRFLSNPWKLLEKGNNHMRRTIIKLAFAKGIQYNRFEGSRTTQIALSFKALGMVSLGEVLNGAGTLKNKPFS